MMPITRTPDPYRRHLLSLGFVTERLYVLSGHASIGEDGQFVSGSFAEQAGRTVEELRRTLEAAGGSLDSVIKLVVFLTDISRHEAPLRALIAERFVHPLPALTVVEVTMRRHPEWLLEIDALAVVGGVRSQDQHLRANFSES